MSSEAVVAVDVVVVTRNTKDMTLSCVRSALAERGAGFAVQCAVVDNGSSDGSVKALREQDIEVVSNDHNAAYSVACNQGIAIGGAPFVVILNSDILVREGAIRTLVQFLIDHPEHVAAGGRIVDPGTDTVQVGHAVRAFPSCAIQIAQMLGLERSWPRNPVSRRALGLDIDYERTQDVDQPPGSCLAVRREALERVGGFDEGFFYWYEDVDLCYRLWQLGPIAYVHDAPFEHRLGATFSTWKRADRIVSWYTGIFRYFRKHQPRWANVVVRGVAATLVALRMAPAAITDRARFRALRTVFRMALGIGSPPAKGAADLS